MADIFRDAPAGHLIRFFTGDHGKLLAYTDKRGAIVSGQSTPQDDSNGSEKQATPSTGGTAGDIVDWYHDHDQDNPQNWSLRKRVFVLVQIMLLNFSGKFVPRAVRDAMRKEI